MTNLQDMPTAALIADQLADIRAIKAILSDGIAFDIGLNRSGGSYLEAEKISFAMSPTITGLFTTFINATEAELVNALALLGVQ